MNTDRWLRIQKGEIRKTLYTYRLETISGRSVGALGGPEEDNVVLPCETTAVGKDTNWLEGSTYVF